MRPSIQYSLLRIGIFLATLLVLWLVGLRDPLWLLLVAATVSMVISLFALAGLRDKFAYDVAGRIEQRRSGRGGRSEKTARRSQAGVRTDAADEDAESDSFR